MSQAIVDPLELRRFAHNLRQFNNDLHERLASLHSQLQALGETWQDHEHERFAEELNKTMHSLTEFLEHSELHIPYLLRKAERVEQYLQQR
jgi:uncharacterized protein YukE